MDKNEKKMKVKEFYLLNKDNFKLHIISGAQGMGRYITSQRLHRPGLALAGFFDRFTYDRIQVIGQTEQTYLFTLSFEQIKKIAEKYFSYDIPLIVVSKSMPLPDIFYRYSEMKGIPIIKTDLVTEEFIKHSENFLSDYFAPTKAMHATLVDVFGVGLLYLGASGIGKSECALDLVERGHRLVGDDIIIVKRLGKDILIGSGNDILGHHMEIRGIGIIDIEKMFGIESIRLQKRIEVAVKLEKWEEGKAYRRLGIKQEQDKIEILGVEIPLMIIPVTPGKNLTVISEVIAMQHMLNVYGYNTAERFNQRLLETMEKKKKSQKYLLGDTE